MTVTIPPSPQHGGQALVTLEISDFCPVCGGPRGALFGTHSYDGSRRLNVDGWSNPCGHVDTYASIREEGKRVAFKEPTEFKFFENRIIPF